jgi:hypothetical protein
MNITGFPNNIDLNPEGYRELGFVKNFRDVKSGVTLNVDDFVINREALVRLNSWVYQEQGRFENVPVTITSDSGTVYPYYLDLKPLTIGLERATTGIQARKSVGHFFENADFLTFELLQSKGFLLGLSVNVPYIIVPDDVDVKKLITTTTILALTYQLHTAIFELSKALAAFSDILPGTGLITAALQLAALIIFFVATFLMLIQAVNDLKELIFPALRNFKAFKDVDLIRKGCEYLGYTLESSVLDQELDKLFTLGAPEAVEGKSIFNFLQNEQTNYFNKGYPTAQDSTPTLGSLIDFFLNTFNLKIFVYDGKVKIERRLDFVNTASVNVIPTLSDQQGHTDVKSFNENDVWGRAYDKWQIDYSDTHSPDTYEGMKSEHITTPINTLNNDLVRLTGLKENSAPFALAGRKDNYTLVEKAILDVLTLVDQVVDAFNNPILEQIIGNSNATSLITKRDGVMIIEKQYFAVTKKLWGTPVNGVLKQPSDYKTHLSMGNIYTGYKLDLQVKSNNYSEKTITVPFTDENFSNLLQNNFVNMEGQDDPVEVVRVEWFDRQYKAELTILTPDDSAFNTQTIKLT